MNDPKVSVECNSNINTHASKVVERLICDQEIGICIKVSRDWADVNLNVQMASAHTTSRSHLRQQSARASSKGHDTYSKVGFASNSQIATHLARKSNAVWDRVMSGRGVRSMVATDREDEISCILRRSEPVAKGKPAHQMALRHENERCRCESCFAPEESLPNVQLDYHHDLALLAAVFHRLKLDGLPPHRRLTKRGEHQEACWPSHHRIARYHIPAWKTPRARQL
jgi:hypothetical protein